MQRKIKVVESEVIFAAHESSEGGYEARAVGYDIFTHALTMDELRLNAREAVRVHFGDTNPLPEIRFVEALPKSRFFGSAKGEFTVPDDFNDPLPKEIEDLFWQ